MGHVYDLWPGQNEDFHNAHAESSGYKTTECTCTSYPFLWNTGLYIFSSFHP